MRWGSILLGAIGLAVLDAVLSRRGATSNVGGALKGAGGLVERFLSPAVPALSSSASSSSSNNGNTPPAKNIDLPLS